MAVGDYYPLPPPYIWWSIHVPLQDGSGTGTTGEYPHCHRCPTCGQEIKAKEPEKIDDQEEINNELG